MFGDVIEPDDARHVRINEARFDRWVNLADIDCGERVKITPEPSRRNQARAEV